MIAPAGRWAGWRRGLQPLRAVARPVKRVVQRAVSGGVTGRRLHTQMRRDVHKALAVCGALSGSRALTGPEIIHMDLTNACDNSCVGCWCHSPLLGEKKMPPWEYKQTLPFELVKRLLDDVAALGGTRQIKLVGGGDPLAHPRVLDVAAYIKEKGIACDINTSFSLGTEETVDRIVELRVDLITMSVWAGAAASYVRTHPNKTAASFEKIERLLARFAQLKRERGRGTPTIQIYNVLSNVNAHELHEMVDFGLRLRVEEMQFALLDPIPGKTECLLLNAAERDALAADFRALQARCLPGACQVEDPATGHRMTIIGLDMMLRQLTNPLATTGVYDDVVTNRIGCYAGWVFARILASGDIAPCCKGHRLPMGNIYRTRFAEIWHGPRYREFRWKGKHLPKTDPYFSRIGNEQSPVTGCYNCDNLWQNEPVHAVLESLRTPRGMWQTARRVARSYVRR